MAIKTVFVCACLLASAGASAATRVVEMKSISFDPKVLEVKVGDDVEWKNVSYTDHSATSESVPAGASAFDTGQIAPRKTSKSIRFAAPGVYFYRCSIHGRTMSGKIEAKP